MKEILLKVDLGVLKKMIQLFLVQQERPSHLRYYKTNYHGYFLKKIFLNKALYFVTHMIPDSIEGVQIGESFQCLGEGF